MNPDIGTGAYADAQETGTRALLCRAAGVNLASGQASAVGSRQQAS